MAEEPNKLDITDEMIAERRKKKKKMPSDMPGWMASTIQAVAPNRKRPWSSL